MSHRIAILGSTGSIGTSALEVIRHLRPPYHAAGLSAHSQHQKLLEQTRLHRPRLVACTDPDTPAAVLRQLEDSGAHLLSGPAAMVELATHPEIDTLLASIVGAAGLPAVLAAVRAGKRVALANKESLVVAGSILIPEAQRTGSVLLPVDSEHSAIFQAMLAGRLSEVRRVILTASGGPFRSWSKSRIESATVADAMAHPTWRMGKKITIDSATLFNKGLELIEACWLFNLPPEKIEIVIHPESIVHSMVEFIDGSVIAQLSPPDMRTPIQYALTHPHRLPGASARLDLTRGFDLRFEPPDPDRFPALRIARHVAQNGGTLGSVMNAANETAVAAFLADNLPFGEIPRIVELTIAQHRVQQSPSLADLLEADQWARQMAAQFINQRILIRN